MPTAENPALAQTKEGAVDEGGGDCLSLSSLPPPALAQTKEDAVGEGGGDCRALASALIRFGQETDCKIVAECVETEAELEILRELQVTKAQGYLLGRPGPLGGSQQT